VEKSKECGLEHTSLAKALKEVLAAPENEGIALLPVAAYSTEYDGTPVWRIDLRWEVSGGPGVSMQHVRFHYFTRDGIRQVGFTTCR
jgi:hypothetical protein